MAEDKRYDWLAPAAISADRRAVNRALAERAAAVPTLLTTIPALLRLVAAASPQPQRATPGFSLALDHGTRGWVASVDNGSDVWSERHDDPSTALREAMQRTMKDVDEWSTS